MKSKFLKSVLAIPGGVGYLVALVGFIVVSVGLTGSVVYLYFVEGLRGCAVGYSLFFAVVGWLLVAFIYNTLIDYCKLFFQFNK